MRIKPEEVSKIIRAEIENYKSDIDVSNTGTVLEAGDGIVRIYGLNDIMSGELLEFENGVLGMALNLEENNENNDEETSSDTENKKAKKKNSENIREK